MGNTNLPSPLHALLAVDGSEHSRAALDLLGDLSHAEGSSVTVVAVLDLHHSDKRSTLLAVLERAEDILRQKGVEARSGLLHGEPAGELTRYADEHRPGLIVLGAKGLRATLGILLGGVAQQVVEYAHVPVLIVRAPYRGLKRVLAVTDGSSHSQHALNFLAQFPLPVSTAITVVHVLPSAPHPEMAYRHWMVYPEIVPPVAAEMIEESQQVIEEQEKTGRTLLDAAKQDLLKAGRKVEAALLRGDAATELIEYIRAQEVDLFVAGSRGLSQVQSWLLGSVSRKLIHYAGCSGLIVK